MRVLLAPIFTLAMMNGPSQMATNLNNLYKNPSKETVAKLFDMSLLRDVLEQSIEIKKSVADRNQQLNEIMHDIDG